MPRAKAPRTAIEFVELVDKHGIADAQRVFGCSRRAAEDVIYWLAEPSPAGRGRPWGIRYDLSWLGPNSPEPLP